MTSCKTLALLEEARLPKKTEQKKQQNKQKQTCFRSSFSMCCFSKCFLFVFCVCGFLGVFVDARRSVLFLLPGLVEMVQLHGLEFGNTIQAFFLQGAGILEEHMTLKILLGKEILFNI